MYLSKGHLCLVSNANASNVGPQVIYLGLLVLSLLDLLISAQAPGCTAPSTDVYRWLLFTLRSSPEGHRDACECAVAGGRLEEWGLILMENTHPSCHPEHMHVPGVFCPPRTPFAWQTCDQQL